MTTQSKRTVCQAYTTRGILLARGGMRFNRCGRLATTTREHTRSSLAWTNTKEVHLCGIHAAMFDKGMTGIMESHSR
jgi:hypothetical protein